MEFQGFHYKKWSMFMEVEMLTTPIWYLYIIYFVLNDHTALHKYVEFKNELLKQFTATEA